jgi:hypothetical protein
MLCSLLKVSRHFGGMYRLHLQGRKISQARTRVLATCFHAGSCLSYSLTQKMEAIYSSETSVDFQWTTQHCIPEGSTLYLEKVTVSDSCNSYLDFAVTVCQYQSQYNQIWFISIIISYEFVVILEIICSCIIYYEQLVGYKYFCNCDHIILKPPKMLSLVKRVLVILLHGYISFKPQVHNCTGHDIG